MTQEHDWQPVTLSDEERRHAELVAWIRGNRPGVPTRRYHGGEQDWRKRDLPGALGERAVCKYLGLPFIEVGPGREQDPDYRDAGPYSVRAVDARHKKLRLNHGDRGPVILAYTHTSPRIWLAGWGIAEDLFPLGMPWQRDDRPCVFVCPSFLYPLASAWTRLLLRHNPSIWD